MSGIWQSNWMWAAGAVLGLYSVRIAFKTWRLRSLRSTIPSRFCIVVTGSTHGLGLALIRSFLSLSKGNVRVVLNGRTEADLNAAVEMLRNEFSGLVRKDELCISSFCGDVSHPDDMEALAKFAVSRMGAITHWINNAGISQAERLRLHATPVDEITAVVSTNLIGTLFGTRAALNAMLSQPMWTHIFNMEGTGSRQNPTPQSIAYGASKAALPQV